MCFSAPASFAAGAVISAAGVASVRKAQKPEQKLFAAIPLIFAFQQFTEGVLWITLKSSGHDQIQNVAAHLYLIAALVIWPVAVPLSMRLMEKVKWRKILLTVLTVMGGALSLFYAYCLISYKVTPEIQSFHILYLAEFPWNIADIAFYFYVALTLAPLFVSSVRRMWLFGILMAISFIVADVFYAQYLTSVWCFFAALISMAIYWIVSESTSKARVLASEFQQ